MSLKLINCRPTLRMRGTNRYRPDIDGLRAIAVSAVIIFHAFPTYLNSGFIGVDIFFVISGFLISSIIFTKLAEGSFCFSEFYERRVRRIFPALIVVLLFCLIFGWFFLLADEFKNLGKHVAGGSAFISNFLLWGESGYFDAAAHSKALLHLWSLGIEEQFYILYPLFIWLVWKLRLNVLLCIIVVAISSFSLNMHLIKVDPVATFYSPLTRMWELMVGSILAHLIVFKTLVFSKTLVRLGELLGKIRYINDKTGQTALSNIASTGGLILMGLSFYIIDLETAFPGWLAIMPVMGTFLCIIAGSSGWFNQFILSNKVFVWLGLISFPLYLWHWVLLVLPSLIKGEELSDLTRSFLVVASVFLATFTYLVVEKKLRWGGGKVKTSLLFVAMSIIGFSGYAIFLNDGMAEREKSIIKVVNDGDVGHDEFHRYHMEKFSSCTPKAIEESALRWKSYIRCYQSKENENLDIALIGDSHSEHLFIGLAETLSNKNVVNYVKNALPSVNNEHYRQVFDYVAKDHSISVVIISAYWSFRAREVPPESSLEKEIEETIAFLLKAGKKVYIVQDTPTFSMDPHACKYQRKFRGETVCFNSDRGYSRRNSSYMPGFEDLEKRMNNVHLLRVREYFCDSNSCNMSLDGKLLYRDRNHLNINGSRYLGPYLFQDLVEKER